MKVLISVIAIFHTYEGYLIEAFSSLPLRTTRDVHFVQRKLSSSRENIFIDEQLLCGLQNCESQAKATKLLKEAFRIDTADEKSNTSSDEQCRILFDSLSIPPGASDRRISDGELAIQTKVRNGKDSIIDLIELNGDSDTDRASLALLCLMVSGFLSAVGAEQDLPGPDIVRFIVVWFLIFCLFGFGRRALRSPRFSPPR